MNWQIPLSDIDFGKEEFDAVNQVLQSKWLTMGERTLEFESAFAKYLGAKHAFAVANGTAALHISHQVLGLKEGDEVICPSLTFVATANSILYTGATPVFADVTGYNDLNISPESIKSKITPKTKAITVVHYGGYPCDMENIQAIAREYNLFILEDAAHAPGAEINGKKMGTFGDLGCFSFFSNKNLITGEGGMIVTDNDELADKIKRMRSHGMTTLTWDRHKGHAYSYDVLDMGFNYRIDEIKAALGVVQLSKLDKNNQSRKKLVQYYREKLSDVMNIQIPFQGYERESSFHIFPILVDPNIDVIKFRDQLKGEGIQTSMHYPPIHLFSLYKEKYGYKGGYLPLTEEIANREVTLPLYPKMGEESIEYIAQTIISVLS